MLVAKEISGLQIPEWVPDYIAGKARESREKHRGNPIALVVIDRLVTDPKMRAVWKEFSKQSRENHRRTGRPLHALTERFATPDRNAAVCEFFEFACNVGSLTLRLPPQRTGAAEFDKKAEALWADAERLEKHSNRAGLAKIVPSAFVGRPRLTNASNTNPATGQNTLHANWPIGWRPFLDRRCIKRPRPSPR